MSVEYSGNVVVAGDKVYDFILKHKELAAAYICTIQAGKVIKHIRFDWNDGDVMSWSD